MSIELPALPYARDALAPTISEETIDYHYGKHHNAYVTNLNKMIEGTADADKSLEEIIRSSAGGVFNTPFSCRLSRRYRTQSGTFKCWQSLDLVIVGEYQ